MENEPGTRRGRRPKPQAERLRGLVTTRILMARLSVTSVYGLTRALFPAHTSKSPKIASVERTWRRYVNGSVVPSLDFLATASGERVEAVASDCLRCLQSRAWDVLKGAAIEEWELWEAINGLPLHIRSILFEPDDRYPGTGPRLREFDSQVASAVAALSGFDAIETLVLLTAWARAISSEALRNAVAMTYMECRSTLYDDPELAEHFRELFSLVDKCITIRVFSSSTMKLDVLMPWQGQMRDKVIPPPDQPPSLLEMARRVGVDQSG